MHTITGRFRTIAWLSVATLPLVACGEDGTVAADDDHETSDGDTSPTGMPGSMTATTSATDGGDSASETTAADDDSTTGDPPMTTTDGETETDSSTDSETSDDTTGNVHEACPAGVLSGTIPIVVSDTTVGQMDEFSSGGCGGTGAPDKAFVFTAPEAGPYTFHTGGSSLDTILTILDGECAGTTLSCNDDALTQGASAVSIVLEENQTVTAVVDGFGLTGGAFQLTVTSGQLTCPRDSFDTVPLTINDDTTVAPNEFSASCSFSSSPEFTYEFTAPATGIYTFDTTGSALDAILYVLDGSCGGNELACNNPNFGEAAQLALALDEDQTVTVAVEGNFSDTGPFTLAIGRLDGTCPDQVLSGDSVSATTAGQDNGVAASCGGLSAPDRSYTWTAPDDGRYIIRLTDTAFDGVLAVHAGDNCLGEEIACGNAATSGDEAVVVEVQDGDEITITVDGDGPTASGTFSLEIAEFGCPAIDLGSELPVMTTVNTSGMLNTQAGTCGGSGPDIGYLWTAPHEGTYVVSAGGSNYNVVLYAMNGETCGGSELSCAANGAASRLLLELDEDQAITILGDGSNAFGASDFGNLHLNIAEVVCPAGDLGSTVPQTTMGSNAAAVNSMMPMGCPGGAGGDLAFTFTAPANGTYTFNTNTSSYDTVLYVIDGDSCTGTNHLGCDDDGGDGTQSLLSVNLTAGQTVLVVVDGYGTSSVGNYVLNVSM